MHIKGQGLWDDKGKIGKSYIKFITFSQAIMSISKGYGFRSHLKLNSGMRFYCVLKVLYPVEGLIRITRTWYFF